MDNRRDDGWKTNIEVYTDAQIEAILDTIGIDIESETSAVYLAYCPFHGNRDTPAFAVNKSDGLWICFNPSCGASGNLRQLISKQMNINEFEALRVILKHRNMDPETFAKRIQQQLTTTPEFVQFPEALVDRMYDDFWSNDQAQSYMAARHFTEDTLRYFRVGYSAKTNKVVVPMHDPAGMLIGVIGRTPSFTDKSFKNSKRLPKSRTAYNIHRAKRIGETVIVVEASFDAMRVHQAGYPNVIALLGGYLSPFHIQQLNRYFSRIIIMTDFDQKRFEEAYSCAKCNHAEKCLGHRDGRALGSQIALGLPHKQVLWAAYDSECVYPYHSLEGYRTKPAKDAGDMTDDEIRQCLKNAVTNFEYSQWGIGQEVLPWEDAYGTMESTKAI